MSQIRHIRKHVFGMNQSEFASVAGVTQATVSRWEKDVSPSLGDMARIRDEAIKRKLRWSDKWFFEMPATKASPAPSKTEAA